jgi:molybdopterin-guanine dinucleotide biosynthesis protein A
MEPWQGAPLAQWVLNALAKVVSPVLISANRSLSDYEKLAPGHVLEDSPELRGQGPLAGLLTGMRHAASLGAKAVLVSPCDTPEITSEVLSELISAWYQQPEKPVFAECEGRVHPLHGVYPVALAPLLERHLESGNRRVMVFTEAAGARKLECLNVAGAFKNRNQPKDFEDTNPVGSPHCLPIGHLL